VTTDHVGGGLREQATRGAIWSALSRIAEQSITFGVQIALARLLSPTDFGLVAMVAIFFAVTGVLVDAGLSSAIIQARSVSQSGLNTVFLFSMAVAGCAGTILWLAAPLIAQFYGQAILCEIVRWQSVVTVVGSTTCIQRSLLAKEMNFKRNFQLSMPATAVAGIASLMMALAGWGVWALVGGALLQCGLSTLLFWLLHPWRPTGALSGSEFRRLFPFGMRLAASALLEQVFRNAYPLLIGKFYSAQDVGFYQRANMFVAYPLNNLLGVLTQMAFPLLSKLQDDLPRFLLVFRKAVLLCGFVACFAMSTLAALADPLIRFLVGEKWLPSVPLLQLLCLGATLLPIHILNLQLLMALGRSDVFLRLEVVKKGLTVLAILLTVNHGLAALIYGQIAVGIASLFLNTWYTRTLIGYGLRKQIADFLPGLAVGGVAAGFLLLLLWFTPGWDSSAHLAVGGVLSAVLFFSSLRWMPSEIRSEIHRMFAFLPPAFHVFTRLLPAP
jgi:O-antigen/teichoic acid export membrane protein